ncbi:MAG: nucleotidyltransferase [Chlamydiia bacterium]|nr:nucleotidyltransferase [Chlamydiia bacterium]
MNLKKISLENLAGLVSQKLQEHGIDNILVGGACVSIYTQNLYQSYDLDFITYESMKNIEKALEELDFKRKGNAFTHRDCKFFIEFVSPPVAIGHEPIEKFHHHKTPIGTIKMLTATDSVKDRLASFYHWRDTQSLDQAILICQDRSNDVKMHELKTWSEKEGFSTQYQEFRKKLLGG